MPRAPSKSSKSVLRPEIRAVLAVNILSMRGDKGWSQEALAFEAGLHRTFIAHVERHARNISLDNLDKIAAALGVETYELLIPGAAHKEIG